MQDFLPRSHYCGDLNASHADEKVRLYGWVHRVRDLGGLTFIQLRDVRGIVQVVCDQQDEVQDIAAKLGAEWVVAVEGTVRQRAEKDVNDDMATGAIEVLAHGVKALAQSDVPPFQIDEKAARASDALRLQYRYLDLRRPEVAHAFKLRSRLTGAIHRYMQDNDFLHVETPELCKSTPEGARDFLVPSRREPGAFYALPQSPQLFKQLLMVAGFDRYYQLARCFRDEDFRADRSVEFTQLDVETSFTSPDGIFTIIEGLVHEIASSLPEVELPTEGAFQRMTYAEAMARYGSDKPDLRYGFEIHELSDYLKKVGTTGFRAIDGTLAEPDGVVRAILVPGGAGRYSRKKIDALSAVAQKAGGKGVLAVKWTTDSPIAGPLAKAMGDDGVKELVRQAGGGEGDLLVLAAGPASETAPVLGAVRLHLIELEEVQPQQRYAFLWLVDFPWLERDEESDRYIPLHHPFTKPRMDDFDQWLKEDPGKIRAQAYDLVLNGYELGGGSVRIHDVELQNKMFELLGIEAETARSKFGFLLDALRFGAPPHAGIALGIDRLAAIIAGKASIRDVIAFPKTGQGNCPLTSAPTTATAEQLAELGLSVTKRD